MAKGTPLLSIVISNLNAKKYLETCVGSVLASDYPNLEVFLVDDHSDDGGPEFVASKFGADKRLHIIVNERRHGLTRVFNKGYEATRGTYIVFMHSDGKVDPDCFSRLVARMEREPQVGAAQPKILSLEDSSILLSAGQHADILGYPAGPVGKGEKDSDKYEESDIFSCWNACMIVRRSVLEEVGLWDPDYNWFREEEDLAWRILLRGYRILYFPDAHAYHKASILLPVYAVDSAYNRFKNYLANVYKYYDTRHLLIYFPLACAGVFARLFLGELIIMRKPSHVWAALKGIWWLVRHYGALRRQRRHAQRDIRRVPDSQIQRLMKRPSLRVYLKHVFFMRRTFAARRPRGA